MPILSHDDYFNAPVQARAAGVSNDALETLGSELAIAYIVATVGSEPPLRERRKMKPTAKRVFAALVLKILRELKVDTLPNIRTEKGNAEGDCPACGAQPVPGTASPLLSVHDAPLPNGDGLAPESASQTT